jgi:hypothetical protein
MRCLLLAVAGSAALVAGCLGSGHFWPGPSDIFALDTWTTIPDGQTELVGHVGDIFHLPLGRSADSSGLVWLRVTVNGKPLDVPEYHTSTTGTYYVFRAKEAGRYQVQVARETYKRDYVAPPGTPDGTPPPRLQDSSWAPRSWQITITP